MERYVIWTLPSTVGGHLSYKLGISVDSVGRPPGTDELLTFFADGYPSPIIQDRRNESNARHDIFGVELDEVLEKLRIGTLEIRSVANPGIARDLGLPEGACGESEKNVRRILGTVSLFAAAAGCGELASSSMLCANGRTALSYTLRSIALELLSQAYVRTPDADITVEIPLRGKKLDPRLKDLNLGFNRLHECCRLRVGIKEGKGWTEINED
jgi:hypothetical protein